MSSAKILSRRVIFDGYHRLEEVVCRPKSLRHDGDAADMSREVFYAGASVSNLLYVPETDEVLLNRQFRIGACMAGVADPFLLECVDGRIDGDEAPETAARREIREETGADALDLMSFGTIYSSPGPVAQCFHLFVARIARPDTGIFGSDAEGEEIETRLFPVAGLAAMLDGGQIRNVTTALLLNAFLRRRDEIRSRWLG